MTDPDDPIAAPLNQLPKYVVTGTLTSLDWHNSTPVTGDLASKSPESAASAGFIVIFPLAFVSNAMVPTQHMPGWLRVVADWNPVSAVTAGARHLWGNPNPSATINAWPMQHPVLAGRAGDDAVSPALGDVHGGPRYRAGVPLGRG